MKKIIITESQFNKLFILTESQESKSISQAKKLLMNRLGYSDAQADEFIRIKLRNDFPVLRSPQGGKFILGVTRMFLDGEIRDADTITQLNSTLKLIASDAHINEYDRNLNGMHTGDLIERFETARGELIDQDRENLSQGVYERNNDYKIIPINSFEEAQQYGQYTSWCVTHSENMFDSYTSNGMNQFYFCLKNGFENLQPQQGKNCPLDEYGLSMIAVSVDSNGALNTCTCRWNHDNGGNDSIMDTKEISQVIGQNFYEVFKPNNKFKEEVEICLQKIASGENPEYAFDYCEWDRVKGGYTVCLSGKWNWLTSDGQLGSDEWYDSIKTTSHGYYVVENKKKENLFNKNFQPVFPQWFDYVRFLDHDFLEVCLNEKINFINTQGELVSDIWFDYWSLYLQGGYYEIEANDKYNILMPNKQFFSKTWFDLIGSLYEGWIHVKLEGKHNFINLHGNYLLDKWVDYATNFSKGFAVIKDGQLFYLIKPDGSFISPVGFDEYIGAVQVKDIIARVFKNGLYYFIDQNGNYTLITYDNSLDWRDDNIAEHNQETIKHNNSHPSN